MYIYILIYIEYVLLIHVPLYAYIYLCVSCLLSLFYIYLLYSVAFSLLAVFVSRSLRIRSSICVLLSAALFTLADDVPVDVVSSFFSICLFISRRITTVIRMHSQVDAGSHIGACLLNGLRPSICLLY